MIDSNPSFRFDNIFMSLCSVMRHTYEMFNTDLAKQNEIKAKCIDKDVKSMMKKKRKATETVEQKKE